MTRIALVLVAVTATATATFAEAQAVASFDRLGLLVNQGDRITVTDDAGQELQGRIVDLSPSTLSLLIDNVRHDLHEADISSVRQRHRDSVKNGAALGYLFGATFGGIVVANGRRDYDPRVGMAAALLYYGGIGAGIGAGVDALLKRWDSQVIYKARDSSRRITVSPLLSRDRRVLSLSVDF